MYMVWSVWILLLLIHIDQNSLHRSLDDETTRFINAHTCADIRGFSSCLKIPASISSCYEAPTCRTNCPGVIRPYQSSGAITPTNWPASDKTLAECLQTWPLYLTPASIWNHSLSPSSGLASDNGLVRDVHRRSRHPGRRWIWGSDHVYFGGAYHGPVLPFGKFSGSCSTGQRHLQQTTHQLLPFQPGPLRFGSGNFLRCVCHWASWWSQDANTFG